MVNWKKWNRILGPGILFASAAIGVSHLVQSTRAGANYGYALLWVVLLANVLKYPFFEYGSRYANAKGESIIDGYKRLGNWVLVLFFLATLFSMFFVTAAVGLVTTGFLDNLLGISNLFPEFQLFPVLLLFGTCIGILIFGNFNALNNLIKILGIVLFLSTIIAFLATLFHGPVPKSSTFIPLDPYDQSGILFIVALMGWMPTALDLCSWNSLWTVEKMKSGYQPKLKETLFEFNLGYWIAASLSVCFVVLGTYLIYGTDTKMPADSAGFANQVIKLYTATIGEWSYIPIAASAFSVMFGTIITVFDGYARSLKQCISLLFFSGNSTIKERNIYVSSVLVLGVGALIIIASFLAHFKALVDFATTISFLIAPFIAIANLRLVSNKYIPKAAVPRKWMLWLSYVGILFLTVFAIGYLILQVY